MAGTVDNVPKEKDSLSKNVDANFRDRSRSKEVESKEKVLSRRKSRKSRECDICYVVFAQSHSLKRHMERFGNLKYLCGDCGMKFRTSGGLRCHAEYAHKGETSKKAKLQCPICNHRIYLELHLRSHLCHHHSGWEDMDIFSFDSCPNESQTLAAIESQLGGQTPETKALRKQRTIRLVKELVRQASEDWKETLPNEKPTKSESPIRTFNKSETSPKRKNAKQRHKMTKELKALLSDVVIDKRETKRTLPSIFQGHEVHGIRHKRAVIHSRQSRSSDTRKSTRQSSISASDASLRALHSCKDCYVPLSRINATKAALADLMEREKERTKNLLKMSSRRAGESEKRYESKKPVDQSLSRSWQHQESELNYQIKMLDVQEHLGKFLSSGVFVKMEVDDSGSYASSNVLTEAPVECYDPLGSPRRCDGNVCDANEPKDTDEFAQYPLSLEYPFKVEIANSEAAENSQKEAESFPQCQDTLTPPMKAEPMDCEIAGHSARSETSAKCPEATDPSVKTETLNFYDGVQTEASKACQVEIENQPIGVYVNCGTRDAAECQMATETNEPQIPQEDPGKTLAPEVSYDVNALLQSAEKDPRLRTLISSRICDKLFTTRRTMLRHFREKHLRYFNDAVYCICGKEMTGRRAVERHFSRSCDKVILSYEAPSTFASPCTPVEKTFTCKKCDNSFWLETCLIDHPPNCEQDPKAVMPKQFRVSRNLTKTFVVEEHLEENSEYICRVCDVRFLTVENLLRHVRTFSTNERFPCPICQTVFAGARLLKGHIQSTHDSNSTTTYSFFCDFCNQGFTKKAYKRSHTMHVHSSNAWESTEGYNENYRSETSPDFGGPENRCEVCNLVFSNRKRYADHVSYYDRNERFRCNICCETFEGQYSAHHHGKKVHYSGNAQNSFAHYCAICGEGFTYKTHLHAHTLHVHDGGFGNATPLRNGEAAKNNDGSMVGEFVCGVCSKGFLTDSELLTHLDMHKNEEIMTRVKCARCDAEFATWPSWKLHFENSHSEEANDQSPVTDSSNAFAYVVDSESGRVVPTNPADSNSATSQTRETDQSRSPELVATTPTTSDSFMRLERCTICGANCPGQWGLARHKAMYYNTGAYVCEFCGRKFNWLSCYRDHKLKHFRRDVHNNCFCPICDEGFENVECLEMHTIHLHQQSLEDLRLRSAQHSPRRLLESQRSIQSGPCSESRFGRDVVAYSKETRNSRNLCAEISESYNRNVGYEVAEQFSINARVQDCFDENFTLEVSSNGPSDGATFGACDADFSVVAKDGDRSGVTGNRFYILLGDTINPQAVDNLGKKVYECDKNVGLTSNLFRYDTSLTCAQCNLTFGSKEMLNTHYVVLHMIRRDFEVLKDKSQKQYPGANAGKAPQKEPLPEDDSSDVEIWPTPSVPSQAEKETPDKNGTGRSSAGNISGTTEPMLEIQCDRYRCTACDIIFADKKLLKIHDESVHGSQMPGDNSLLDSETERLSAKQSVACSDRPSPAVEPEEIWISDDESEDNNRLSPTTRNPDETSGQSKAKLTKVRFVNLPPGNYKISKFKIRSTDTIVRKLKKLKRQAERR